METGLRSGDALSRTAGGLKSRLLFEGKELDRGLSVSSVGVLQKVETEICSNSTNCSFRC